MAPLHTPLFDAHREAGGQLVDFAGWMLPVRYGSIVAEARAVRATAGMFDVSHLGRVRLSGPGHVELADRLVSSDVANLREGRMRYGLLTREDGTIIDDVLVAREPDSLYVCLNAGNKHRDLAWIRAHAAGTPVQIDEFTDRTAMIAVQGPRAADIVAPLCATDPRGLRRYGFLVTACCGIDGVMVSRTGYTGEDGFELVVPAERALACWRALIAAGAPLGLVPAGLGARDTLRLEAGMSLYGHEIDDSTTPVEADLMWAVALEKDFVGAAAIRDVQARGTSRKLVGFVTDATERRVPRYGMAILDGDVPLGQVRSGAFSPALERSIGTAYVPTALAETGKRLFMDLRGSRLPIEIVERPFLRRPAATDAPRPTRGASEP